MIPSMKMHQFKSLKNWMLAVWTVSGHVVEIVRFGWLVLHHADSIIHCNLHDKDTTHGNRKCISFCLACLALAADVGNIKFIIRKSMYNLNLWPLTVEICLMSRVIYVDIRHVPGLRCDASFGPCWWSLEVTHQANDCVCLVYEQYNPRALWPIVDCDNHTIIDLRERQLVTAISHSSRSRYTIHIKPQMDISLGGKTNGKKPVQTRPQAR